MDIPGFSRYTITKDGVVIDKADGKIVKPYRVCIRGYNYIRVNIIDDNNKRHTCSILRLLAFATNNTTSTPGIARPLDGDYKNVSASNIRWQTYADHTKELWSSGALDKRCKKTSITEDVIALVYDAMLQYEDHITMSELSRLLDMPYSQIRYSVAELRNRGKVVKHSDGFEAL